MALEPTEQDFLNIHEVTGLSPISDRQLIINAWKASNGNIDVVVSEYYTDPDQFHKKHRWDEGAFGTDRDGGMENWQSASVPSFQIDAPDNGIIEGQPASSFMAPTRPPSRTQSPLGKLIDLASTPDFSSLSAAVNTNTFDNEDADLQRALAESAKMSGIQSPQETGITNDTSAASNPVFGPATRDNYDMSQWAMVPTAATKQPGQEPGPQDRRRAPGVPAFLRYRKDDQWNKHRLGPLLTVLHSIPAIRNGLLASGGDQEGFSYGSNKEWWKGQPIKTDAMEDQDAWSNITKPDLEQELHRLMAFLDLTERSYGSADILTELGTTWTNDHEQQLFEDLKDRNEMSVWKSMWSKVVEMDYPTGETIPQSDPHDFVFLDISHGNDRNLQVETTYDAIDSTMWPCSFTDSENSEDEPRFGILSHPGDVLTIRIQGVGLQKPLRVLPVIYLDRYLEDNKESTLELLGEIRAVNDALAQGIKRKEALLQVHVGDFNSKPLDPRELSKKAIERNKAMIEELKGSAFWRKHQEEVEMGEESDFSQHEIQDFDQLSADEREVKTQYEAEIILHEHKLADIDRKLKKLDSEVATCQKLLMQLRGQLTDPDSESDWNPQHKYTLRGVITGPQTLYLCKQPEEKLIVFDDNVTTEQWWRLAYLPDAMSPLSVEKTTLQAVEESLLNETEKPIFIYANEAAMNEKPMALPDNLHAFVKLDNRLFKQELIEETPRPSTGNDKKRISVDGPSSPPKRRARAHSTSSMDTNRANASDIDSVPDDDFPLDQDQDLPEMSHVEHVGYEDPAGGHGGDFEGAFGGEESFYRQQEQDGALGTEMVQLAISRPMSAATGPVMGTEGSFQTYIADWDNPDGKREPSPPMVKPAKERKALDE